MEKFSKRNYFHFFFLALVDLNGRFFGGREVDADCYNVQDFHNNLLKN